jgi:hypothetical protein
MPPACGKQVEEHDKQQKADRFTDQSAFTYRKSSETRSGRLPQGT